MRWHVWSIGFLLGLGMLGIGQAAWAAPDPDFVATPVQGGTCVAPCAYHFDAIGNGSDLTRDPAVARPFHTLRFEWDFGDPGSGVWPVSGLSRDRAQGAIAGHLYERPGRYAVQLSVTNPDGQRAAVERTVTVTDPNQAFAASQTWCFANSGVPGGAGFEACPVRSASSHVVIGSSAVGGFATALSRCDVRSRKPRCLFRRGDRFRSDSEVALGDRVAGPGLIGAFGSGARPVVDARGGRVFGIGGDGWTVHDLDVVAMTADTGLFKLYNEESHFTAFRVRGRNLTGGCVVSSASNAPTHSDLVAIVDVQCLGSPTIASSGGARLFLRTERTLILGGVFDNAYKSSFVLRTVHFPRSVMQHARISRPDAGHNAITLRSWAGTSQGVCGATNPPPSPTRYVILSDNLIEQQTDNTIVRSCQANECQDASCSTGFENVIFERNFLRLSSGGPTPNQGISRVFWLQGGDITVRNNVVDLQGVRDGLDQRLVQHGPNMHGADSRNGNNMHVLNNTVYYDDALSQSDFAFCNATSTGSGHRCENNLGWLPGNRGDKTAASGGGWSTAANVFATSNPFAGAPPAQGATLPEDFQLATTARSAVDAGVPAQGVSTDFDFSCRPADGDGDSRSAYDVGAWEARAGSACLATAQPTGDTVTNALQDALELLSCFVEGVCAN